MSLGWMAFVAALIAAEKLAPNRRAARLLAAALLAALGTTLLAAPGVL